MIPNEEKEEWHYRAILQYLAPKKMLLLIKEELKPYHDAKVCYVCGKRILNKLSKGLNYLKVRDHYYPDKYRGAAYSICQLNLNVPNEIPVVFHNDSNYDYCFIIKKLANEFEVQLKCLGENTENYKTNIDSARFMVTSLSNLVHNLSDGVHKIKCKCCGCFLQYESVKGNVIKYKCLS